MTTLEADLRAAFRPECVTANAPLAPWTTFKVGGPAEWSISVRTAADLTHAVRIAGRHQVPLTLIGGGSNLLVADEGIRGLVVRVKGGAVRTVDERTVRADAGVTINALVRWTVSRGIAGIEAWAGTPGTVGGAIHGNAHFQGRLISELIAAATLVSRSGDVATVSGHDMEFGYDYSRLHRTGEIVLSADFRVGKGDPQDLRETARRSLAFRKRTQPLEKASAGCIFQNPDPRRDPVPAGIPPSAGALVERAGFKGAAEGGAHVSTRHANFIVNDGHATADDIVRLIERCREGVREQFGIELRDEVVRLGFARREPHGQSQG